MSVDSFQLFKLTGNIFVDSGQLTLQTLMGISYPQVLSIKEILSLKTSNELFGIDWVSKNLDSFNSFTMIFGTNHMRMQYVYKPDNEKIFKGFLLSLIDGIEEQQKLKIQKNYVCDICGCEHNYDFNVEFDKILKENYQKYDPNKESHNFVCRELFPLAGSMGSEAQSYSNMSLTHNICPRCLLMVHYLPFSSEVIEGNLALFQISNLETWQEFIQKNCNENRDVINNTPKGKKYENLGKKLKSKNFRIFEHFIDYYKQILPGSPSRQDFLNNFPQQSLSVVLWKYSNSGQGAYLEYESIPNTAINFLYLCYCFDLNSIKQIIDQELRKIKYSPKQLYNSIRKNELYQFERLIDNKFHPNIYLQFLYYYYILGYKAPEIELFIKIAAIIIKKYQQEDLITILKKRANIIIFQTIREIIIDENFPIEVFLATFGLKPSSQRWKEGFNIIKQLCKTDVSQKSFDSFKNKIRAVLDENNINHYESLNPINFEDECKILINNFIQIYNYFESKFNPQEIQQKITIQKMKNATCSWFGNIYASVSLTLNNDKFTYENFQYLLSKFNSWFNLRMVFQILFIIYPKNKKFFSDYKLYEYEVPDLLEKKFVNMKLKNALEKYLHFRIVSQNKGINYIKKVFITPILRGSIKANSIRNFFEDHAEEIGYNNLDWEDLMIDPMTGLEDITFFMNYVKIHSCSFITNPNLREAIINENNILDEDDKDIKDTDDDIFLTFESNKVQNEEVFDEIEDSKNFNKEKENLIED